MLGAGNRSHRILPRPRSYALGLGESRSWNGMAGKADHQQSLPFGSPAPSLAGKNAPRDDEG